MLFNIHYHIVNESCGFSFLSLKLGSNWSFQCVYIAQGLLRVLKSWLGRAANPLNSRRSAKLIYIAQ